MASNFDRDKYKDIFEKRYGSGSYESGMSKARAAGKAKAGAEFAKDDYERRLKEAEKAAKEAEKEAKRQANEEAKRAKERIKKDEEARAKRGAELNAKMKKGKLTVEDMENTPKDRWAAIPSSTKGNHDGKKLTSSNALKSKHATAFDTYFKNETKKAIVNNPKPKTKKKKKSNVVDDLLNIAKDAFQVNVLKQNPKKVYANTAKDYVKKKKDISPATKELSRGIVRATDSALLGTVKEASKKTKNADVANELFFNDREIGKGGVTDMITSGLGYLVPGAGTYKALNATKAGKALTKAGSKGVSQRLLTESAKGGITGGAMAGAEVGIRESLNPDDTNWVQNSNHVAMGATIGGLADPALYGLGKALSPVARRAGQAIRNWKRGDKVQTPNGEGEVVGTSIPKIGDKTPVVRVQTPDGKIEAYKPEMLALPAPKTRGPLEQFTQPRGLDNPIPSFSPTVRNRMTASALRNDDFVGFGQRSKPVQARQTPMVRASSSRYDDLYEGFAKWLQENNYNSNNLSKESLDELFTHYAPYNETASLDEVVENVYKNNPGFNRTEPQYDQPISPAEPALDDLLRRDPRINQALESFAPKPQDQPTQSSLDDLMKQLEGSVQDAYASGSIDTNPTRPQVNKAEEELYNTANELMKQGRDDEALKMFEAIAKGESSSQPSPLEGGLRLDGQFFNPDAQVKQSPTPINLSDPKKSVSAIDQQTNPIKRIYDKFYEGAINFRHSLHVGDIVRTQSALNKAISAGDDKAIEKLTNRLASAKKNGSQIEKAATNEEAAVNITKSILDRHMNGLTKVLKDTDVSVTDALHYQLAKNVRYIWDNVDPEYKLAKGWDKERINRIINDGDLGKNKETFKQSAQTFKGMMDEVRQIMLDYDLKPQEEIDLLSKNEFYIPMSRDRGWQKDNVSSGQKFNRRDTINAELDLYNLEGGDLENYLKNPLESLAELTHAVVRKGLQNDTALELKKLADIETDFPDNDQVLVRYAKNDETPDIVGTQGGKEFKLVVQEDMKEILDSGADPKIPSNFLAKLTRTYAGLKTRSLAHQIVAVPRDLTQGYWNSQINDPIRYLAEMANAIKSSNIDAKKVGALFEAGYNDHTGGVKSHNKLIEDFKKQYSDQKFNITNLKDVGGLVSKIYRGVTSPAAYLGQQSDSIMRNIEVREIERQYTPRIQQLEKEIAEAQQGGDFSEATQGLDVKVQELDNLKKEMRREQTYQARDMMNYQRTGRAGFVKNIVKPYAIFANTTTQSKDKFFRSFKKNPLGMTAKVGVPVAGMYMAQQTAYENASAEDKKMLDLAPDYVKNYYYMFPDGEGSWTLVPKPHEAIPIISAIEAGAEKYLNNRETSVGDPMNEVFRMIAKEYVPFQLGHLAQAAVPDRYGDLGGATVPGSLPTLATNILANKKLDYNGKPISYDNPYPVKGTGGEFNPDEGQMLLGNGLTQELASAPWTPEYAKSLGGESVNADYIDYVIQNLFGDIGKVGSGTAERAVQGEDQLEALLRDLTYRKVHREGYTDRTKEKFLESN